MAVVDDATIRVRAPPAVRERIATFRRRLDRFDLTVEEFEAAQARGIATMNALRTIWQARAEMLAVFEARRRNAALDIYGPAKVVPIGKRRQS